MITILRSQVATLCVLTLALLAQLPHAAWVFMQAGAVEGATFGVMQQLHGYSYAIALELAVLLFVVQGRRTESYGFAFVSVLVNLAYYANHRVDLASANASDEWLISLALPIAIALYSHSLAGDDDLHVSWSWLQVARKWLPVQAESALQVAQIDQGATMQIAEVAFATDAQAEDLQVDDAQSLAQDLRNAGRKIAEIAQTVGKSPSWVSRNTQPLTVE